MTCGVEWDWTYASSDDPLLAAVCGGGAAAAAISAWVDLNCPGNLSKSGKGKRMSDLNATLVKRAGDK